MSILIFFIILSILVLIHELGHFITAKKNNVFVEEFGFGLPPRLFGIKIGETIYSINWLPFGGFVKVYGEEAAELGESIDKNIKTDRAFVNKKPLVKLAILVAGVFFNFLLGWVIISYLFTQGVSIPTGKIKVESVTKGSPAQLANIETGDIINSLEAEEKIYQLENVDELVVQTQKFAGKKITLSIERNSQILNRQLVPRRDPPKGEGALGITISSSTTKKYSWFEAPFLGLVESVKLTGLMIRELALTLYRVVTLQQTKVDVAGPVGIYFISKDAAEQGMRSLLQLLGLLSLNLAVINILPFPALDGGRVAMVLYEWGSGKKVNPEFERKLNIAGFAFLISLILLVTINDII